MKSYKVSMTSHSQIKPTDGGRGGREHKSDAITVGRRRCEILWVRNNIGTIKDSKRNLKLMRMNAQIFSITFRNLLCTWKDWFKGRLQYFRRVAKSNFARQGQNEYVVPERNLQN
jgi:hypothetical protein